MILIQWVAVYNWTRLLGYIVERTLEWGERGEGYNNNCIPTFLHSQCFRLLKDLLKLNRQWHDSYTVSCCVLLDKTSWIYSREEILYAFMHSQCFQCLLKDLLKLNRQWNECYSISEKSCRFLYSAPRLLGYIYLYIYVCFLGGGRVL